MPSVGEGKKQTYSDDPSNQLCSPCERQNRNTKAEIYCADCSDYYCSECVNVHNNFPAMSGHKFLENGQFKSLTRKDIPLVPTERCERHSFKVVDIFCQNHEDVGCYTCMAVDHRSCQDVLYIPEYIQKNNSVTASKDILKRLQEVADHCKDKLEEYKKESKRLMQRKVEEVEKIKAFRKEINLKFDELEKKSIEEIEREYNALIKKIDDDIVALSTSQTEITSSNDDITSTFSNPCQQFVSMKRGNVTIKKALKCTEAKAAEFSRSGILLERNQKLRSLLQELTTLGEINGKPFLYKIKEKKTYNVKHQSDETTCGIYSACIVPSGSLILADFSNKKIKRLDGSTYIIDDTCELPMGPWQVYAVEKHEVAVCFGNSQEILFIGTESKMKVTREMKTDHYCYGIGYRNGYIYVTDSNTTVFVYNITGTKLQQFSKDQSGQTMFSDIYSLTVSNNDNEKIYVADNKYGLVVLSQDGNLLGKYTCPERSGPREICVMDDRSILVCTESLNNIVRFASDGKVMGEVLPSDGGKGGCRAVCFDCRHSRLILGRYVRDEIEICDIS